VFFCHYGITVGEYVRRQWYFCKYKISRNPVPAKSFANRAFSIELAFWKFSTRRYEILNTKDSKLLFFAGEIVLLAYGQHSLEIL
jgi:hypothetical protein